MHFFGTYLPTDVEFLLDIKELQEISILEKEKLIQTGIRHYSEVLTEEMDFSEEYLTLFIEIFKDNISHISKNILTLTKYVSQVSNPILISLARAGTPYGVSIKRNLETYFGIYTYHYSISIIIDKGIDRVAMDSIITKHGLGSNYIFIDGWTGKGTILSQLRKSLAEYNTALNYKFIVLSDVAGVADVSATEKDYIIPSCLLNSTISGLISRTLINHFPNQYHGAKFYAQYADKDLSLFYVDQIDDHIKKNRLYDAIEQPFLFSEHQKNISETLLQYIMNTYNITNRNFIKPGIGETTRVLIRRNPDFVLINQNYTDLLKHVLHLCKIKNVKVYYENEMPVSSVGVINKFQL
jgi:hypothetical protein